MPISVTCDDCGKTLKAPDTAAGKKAKCPGCGGVIKIPEPIYEAEDVVEEEEAYEDYEDDVEDYEAPVRSKKSRRKPCPACGELILADAAKCRYCDEVFDETLKKSAKSKGSKSRSGRKGSYPLADPGKRLLSAIIDNFIIGFIATPVILLGAMSEGSGQEPNGMMALLALMVLVFGGLGYVAFLIYMYSTRSQSIGKYLMNTMIVDYETGKPASVVQCFLLRDCLNSILSMIPLYRLVDLVCIFTAERRCIHDLLAGTSVVDVS